VNIGQSELIIAVKDLDRSISRNSLAVHNMPRHQMAPPLIFSLARFTYVPDEYFNSIEDAFSAKPLAGWTVPFTPLSDLSLAIVQEPDSVVMKCVDGKDVRVFALLAVSTHIFLTIGLLEFVCHQNGNAKRNIQTHRYC
jgi:hypothetical protein